MRKYYDRWHSLLKQEEASRKAWISIPRQSVVQGKVIAKATCESIVEIDCALLEPSKDESGMEVKVHVGSGVCGCCNEMFYRGNPIAVKTFYPATVEELK